MGCGRNSIVYPHCPSSKVSPMAAILKFSGNIRFLHFYEFPTISELFKKKIIVVGGGASIIQLLISHASLL